MPKKKWLQLLRLLPLCLMLFLLCWLLFSSADFSTDAIVAVLPKNTVGAIAVMMALFVLKSLAVTFPIAVFWVVSGLMFPLPLALSVSLAGTVLGLTLPFWIVRVSGFGLMDRLTKKYPKAKALMRLYENREFFFSYIVRYLPLPMDIASMLVGSLQIPYRKFLTGGLLGLMPQMIAHTVLGSAIFEPGSPAFIGSLAAMLLIGAVSLFFYAHELRKQPRD